MGLFSTLASATVDPSQDAAANDPATVSTTTQSSSSSSSTLPTVIQLYTHTPILLEGTPNVTGYSAMTYQAVQSNGGDLGEEFKSSKHANPDLGVWNCHVTTQETPLVHSLLQQVAPKASSYCLTVDLKDETQVEPQLSLLQSTLVRHLIDHASGEANEEDAPNNATKTTSLYDLQAVQFGLAPQDKATEQSIDEASKDVKISLLICAVLPAPETEKEVSESAYKQKQARALIMYHLRKFAHAVNAALVFVQDKSSPAAAAAQPSSPSKQPEASPEDAATVDDAQPAVPYETLSQLWRDLALGKPVWEQQEGLSSTSTATAATADDEQAATTTPLYGPGKQQEDLIETVLLRNANYPGHWEASKDSLWAALPAPQVAAAETKATPTGDAGWLTQLRDSIASALPAEKAAAPAAKDKEEKPKEKDAAVSSFFESLLKDS